MTDLRWPDGPSVTSAPASMDTSPERLFARIGERDAAAVLGHGADTWADLKDAQQYTSVDKRLTKALGAAQQPFSNRLNWRLFRARLKIEDTFNHAYDAKYNVQTAKEEQLADCGVSREDAQRGNSLYRVTWGWLIRKALRQLHVDHSRYTFIDYGAGKGKAMLMASDYPFRRIIGLEYSEKLHAIAAANCRTYRSPAQKCHALEPILTDVLDYEPPCGPIVCFMCNPFDNATTQAVFDRWRGRHGGQDRDIRIMYLNMRTIREKASVLDEQPWLLATSEIDLCTN